MRKSLLTGILSLGCLTASYAQTDVPATSQQRTSSYDQYVGVQMNDLIRQVFNFNNSTSSTSVNPYLLTYNINSKKSGWGIRVGVGYNYNSSNSTDNITTTDSKINDLQFRLGIEKAFKLSDKWSAGAGIDFLLNTNDDKTVATTFSFDTVVTTTKTTITSYGAGPMAWLRYHVTPHVLVGTEASFYYLTGKEKQTISVIDQSGFNPPQQSSTSPTVTTGTFNSPIVFYLIVKF
jgi:hypothetical protein